MNEDEAISLLNQRLSEALDSSINNQFMNSIYESFKLHRQTSLHHRIPDFLQRHTISYRLIWRPTFVLLQFVTSLPMNLRELWKTQIRGGCYVCGDSRSYTCETCEHDFCVDHIRNCVDPYAKEFSDDDDDELFLEWICDSCYQDSVDGI